MRQSSDERASALMLVPAGMLVLMILGAISVDSTIAFMAHRELQNQTAAVANDVVTMAIDDENLQLGPAARPDPHEIDRLVHARLDGYTVGTLVVDADDVESTVDATGTTVTVRAAGEVSYIFARAVPGAKRSATVVAESSARVVVSP